MVSLVKDPQKKSTGCNWRFPALAGAKTWYQDPQLPQRWPSSQEDEPIRCGPVRCLLVGIRAVRGSSRCHLPFYLGK